MSNSEEKIYFDFGLKPGQKIEKEFIKEEKIEPIIDIITVYSENSIKIHETINSIINQTFPYWRWNIIDICNMGETERKLTELSQNDTRINLHSISKQDINENIINKIIKESNCDFIFMLKPDDVLDQTTLECSYWTLMTNLEASWCYTNYVVNEKILESTIFSSKEEKIRNIVNSSYLIRKKDISQVEEYISDDWKLFLKLLEKNKFPVKMNFYGSWNKEKNIIEKENIDEYILKVKNNIVGINYPVGGDYWFNTLPFEVEWNKKILRKDNKYNLLFIFPWFRVGGADKFNYDLISNLDKEKYSITILTTEPCPYIWRQKFEKYAEVFDLTSFLHRENWATFIHYIMKTRNVRLVMNSNSYYGYYVIPWLKYKFPEVIFTDYLHAINWNWRHGEYPGDSTAISRLLDKTFVSSNQVKEVMEKSMKRKVNNTETIYIGVDDKKFNENNPEIICNTGLLLENKEKYENKKVILFCSRISQEKRPMLMLKIFEELNKTRKDLVLFVVGDGSELQEMIETAQQLNLQENIIFFGMQDDVRPFYKIANVLVICSIREGITLTTYEALAMSTPIVSADVGGQKELINNSCGRIVQNIQKVEEGEKNKQYDIEEIRRYSDAIIEILDNPQYEQMKENCRAIVEEKFSIDKMSQKMNEEFERLIQNGTTIPKQLVDNEELYKQYLLMYNEIDRRYYNSPKGGIMPEPEETIEQKLQKQLDEEIKQLKDKEEEIRLKNMQIENLQKKIEDLQKETQEIYSSKRWKYVNRILNLFGK